MNFREGEQLLQYLIMCRSLTYAQRASKALEKAGITAIVSKAPHGSSASGCAYCVKVSEKRMTDALRILKINGLGPGKILIQEKDIFREVHDFD